MNREELMAVSGAGNIKPYDTIAAFLYVLMKEVPIDKIEGLIGLVTEDDCVFSNGWLVQYANYLSEQLYNGEIDDSLEYKSVVPLHQSGKPDPSLYLTLPKPDIIADEPQAPIEKAKDMLARLKESGANKEEIDRIEEELLAFEAEQGIEIVIPEPSQVKSEYSEWDAVVEEVKAVEEDKTQYIEPNPDKEWY